MWYGEPTFPDVWWIKFSRGIKAGAVKYPFWPTVEIMIQGMLTIPERKKGVNKAWKSKFYLEKVMSSPDSSVF